MSPAEASRAAAQTDNRDRRNAAALYAVQASGLVIPLATLPYLTRHLGAAAWGQLAAVQSLAAVLSLVVEYGYIFSGARSIAATKDSRSHSEVVRGITSAKLLLTAGLLLLAAVIYVLVPKIRVHPAVYWFGVSSAVAQGYSPLWYFQGKQRLVGAALVEVVARALAAGAVFALVRTSSDAYLVPLSLTIALTTSSGLLNLAMFREVRPGRPAVTHGRQALREGRSLFLFRVSVALYTTANSFLLRLFTGPVAVANFANADKVATAGRSMLMPLSQIVFPKTSALLPNDVAGARRLTERSLVVLTGLATAMGLALLVLAGPATPLVFGPGYEASVGLTRLLALSLPLLAVNQVLGVQWMVPLGMDRAFTSIITAAGVLNVLVVLILVPPFGATGMAWSIVTAELAVALGMHTYLRRAGLALFSRGEATAHAV